MTDDGRKTKTDPSGPRVARDVSAASPANPADPVSPAGPVSAEASNDPRRVVAAGYDRIAQRYLDWTAHEVDDQVRPRYLSILLEQVPRGARVLDLGCGGGGPTTAQIAERFDHTGVDLSKRQISLSRQRLPHATFIHADMTQVDFPPASFDAVTSFYAFIHLPAGALPSLIDRIATWLRPNALLVATMAGGAGTGEVEPNFLGVPMYFSGYPLRENRRFLQEAGLEIVSLQPEQILENNYPTRFLWTVARKPTGRPTHRSRPSLENCVISDPQTGISR